jgi:hypothetical protein
MLHIPTSQPFDYPPYSYEDYEGLESSREKIFAAEDDLLEHAKQEKSKEWDAARVLRGKLAYELGNDYLTRAQLEIEAFPKHPPDYLHTTGAKRLRLAKNAMQGRDWKHLVRDSKDLHFGSFHLYHLGISEAYEDGALIFTPELIKTVTEALEDHYRGIPRGITYLWKLERGIDKNGALGEPNVHTIADVPNSLKKWAYKGSKILQPIKPGTEVHVLAYCKKQPIYYQIHSYAHFLEVNETKTKRLPNLSGFRNVKRGQA